MLITMGSILKFDKGEILCEVKDEVSSHFQNIQHTYINKMEYYDNNYEKIKCILLQLKCT